MKKNLSLLSFCNRVFYTLRLPQMLASFTVGAICSALLFVLVGIWYTLAFQQRTLPAMGVTIDGIPARQYPFMERYAPLPPSLHTTTLTVGEKEYATASADLGLQAQNVRTFKQAVRIGRSGSLFHNMLELWTAYARGYKFTSPYAYNEDDLRVWIRSIAVATNTVGSPPSAELRTSGAVGSLLINSGKDSVTLDIEESLLQINKSLPNAPIRTSAILRQQTALTPEEVNLFKQRAEQLVGKSMVAHADEEVFTLRDQDLVKLLSPRRTFGELETQTLVQQWANKVNRPSQEPVLHLDGNTVKEFIPPVYGRELDVKDAYQKVFAGLQTFNAIASLLNDKPIQEINLLVETTQPKTSLGSLNSIGIKERIGFANSTYFHSIPGRVHNVKLTASKIHNIIIPQGEVFSFNKYLGEVSAATGYQPAYVIKEGRSILGDGGGVCQVSSTFFRTSLNAGLPILERRGHSYRVGYYEQNSKPGFDATVFSPSPDLKIKNDTTGAILIRAVTDSANYAMFIEFWGTADGRKAEILNYKLWNQSPPRATIHQDDPTLRKGVVRQVDWSAPGANTSFEYKVTRNGEVLQNQTFTTAYQPWAAVFLHGTKE